MSTRMMILTGISTVAFFLFKVWTEDYVKRHGWEGFVTRIARTAFKFQLFLMAVMGAGAVYSLSVYYSAGLPPSAWPLGHYFTGAEILIFHVTLCFTLFAGQHTGDALPRITIGAALTSWAIAIFCLYCLWRSCRQTPALPRPGSSRLGLMSAPCWSATSSERGR